MMKVSALKPVITNPDDTVSIADLAKFVEFDPNLARRYNTAVHCIAYDALLDAYRNHEFVDGDNDYYDGFWMKFADGSEIRV